MRRKQIAALLGTMVITAAIGGTVQAKTYCYAWDSGEGICRYQVTDRNAGSIGEEESEAVAAGKESAASGTELWGDDMWYQADMQDLLSGLEKYGVTLEDESGTIRYGGKKVRFLIDEQKDQSCRILQMEGGEIDLYTVRDDNCRLTGVRQASQEEYETRSEAEFFEYDPEEEETSVKCEVAEGSVEEVLVFRADTQEENKAEEFQIQISEDGRTAEVICESASAGEAETVVETAAESTAAEAQGQEEILEAQESLRSRDEEYAEFGITLNEGQGVWLWKGKPVYLLMDEDGGFYMNSEAQEGQASIYLVVKRDASGKIKEVKQVTAEEAVQHWILKESKLELEAGTAGAR